ncbi:MAG: mandelate racemase/muconate lactonizing enzyme family protein [Planctomycetes bacterium]|nr:mandelate racemase/muconate lactonizing enzyme family protein [Planctomycetota bacterium]
MKIAAVRLTEVVVPAKPDSVNSPETDHALHQLAYNGARGFSVQFDAMPKVIIEVITDDGLIGLGESYRGLPLASLEPIARRLIGLDPLALNLQELPLPEGRLYDGFECALVDLVGKRLGVPAHVLLGGRYRDEVTCGHWTGHRTVADAARKAAEGRARGFSCIKFKCDLDDPVAEWCAAIRDACGPAMKVILDPNRRWGTVANTLERARDLAAIGNVLCLEDPIPRWDFDGYRLLRMKQPIPVCMHVSLPYLEMGQMPTDVVQAIRGGAVDMFNLNGGMFAVKRLADTARLADIPMWHGSEIDLGILEASYVHACAAIGNATLPHDIFGRLVREHDLLVEPLVFAENRVRVPTGPGLGVELDRDALARYTSTRQEIAA